MYRDIILHALSKSNVNVFDEVIAAIEYEFSRPARDIQEMKNRDNKKKKGDIWEAFCKDWLLATENYIKVWLLDEYNEEFHRTFLTKQDNGIDIIAQTNTGLQSIQCKYKNRGKISWKTLSTFLALSERTGPWEKYIVMTNSTGVTHKLPKTVKDKSICQKTFRNTTREHWLRMIGKDIGYQLIPEIKPLQLVVLKPDVINITTQPKDLDELRRRRLARFEGK